jgi:hypothetical protein
MDQLRERLDALESQVHTLTQHTHTVNRRLRWWRGLACGLAVAGLLGWGLPLGLAREDGAEKDKDQKDLAQRVVALEQLLKPFSREGNEVFITGANLHIRNGQGSTATANELGNLIVGYNELRADDPTCGDFRISCEDFRTGSHNVVVGKGLNFSRFGGQVVGIFNTISGDWSSVSGGHGNTASNTWSSVSGGFRNTASGTSASVSGGVSNTASGDGASSVSGGSRNEASSFWSSVSGDFSNLASTDNASVSRGPTTPPGASYPPSVGVSATRLAASILRSAAG